MCMLIRFLYMEVDKYDKKADCDDSFDGGIDDGSSVMISLDLNTYVIKGTVSSTFMNIVRNCKT